MKHLDERTIELYVLGDAGIVRKKRSIEAHLRRCQLCRDSAAALASFYADVESELQHQPELPALSLTRTATNAVFARRPVPHLIPVESPRRLWSPVRRVIAAAASHPFIVGSSAFVFTAVMLLAVGSYFINHSAGNPVFAHINSAAGMFEIYARDNHKLWQLPLANADAAALALHARETSVAFGDVTGDGKNDVATNLQLEGTPDHALPPLQLIDAGGKMLWKKIFDDERRDFRSATYDNRYASNDIKIADGYIYASVRNGHSPCYIAKINASGKTAAEYWHFGHLAIFMMPDDSGAPRWIVAVGRNDVDEFAGGTFADIIILDARKFSGTAESSISRGFGLEKSDAEQCCIRLPMSDAMRALHAEPGESGVMRADSNGMTVYVRSNAGDASFEYEFNRRMQITEVRTTSQTIMEHHRLKKEGKISSEFGERYLDAMGDAVRYWDGRAWVRYRSFERSSGFSLR